MTGQPDYEVEGDCSFLVHMRAEFLMGVVVPVPALHF